MNKTKKEILQENHCSFGMHQINDEDDVLKAMDEYAKQQAIAFHDWIDTECVQWYDPAIPKKDRVLYTTTELYTQFIESQNNNQ